MIVDIPIKIREGKCPGLDRSLPLLFENVGGLSFGDDGSDEKNGENSGTLSSSSEGSG